MGLFDRLFPRTRNKKRLEIPLDSDEDTISESIEEAKAEILKETNVESMSTELKNNSLEGIEEVKRFLLADFSQQGYGDAIVNSDSSNAEANKEIIKQKLHLKIDDALKFYRHKIELYDALVVARKTAGMLDSAGEITVERNKFHAEVEDLKQIMIESIENRDRGNMPILSYVKGFQRGLGAITAYKLYGKTIDSNE